MRCRTLISPLAMATIASGFTMGCERPAVSELEARMFDAEVASLSKTGQDLPFEGSLDGVANFTFDPAEREARCRTTDVPFITQSAGSGNATHMARLTWSSSHCTELPAGEPPPYYVFERGKQILVAANGDEIHLDYTAEQIDPIDEDDPQPMTLVGHGTITWGTGRFVNAAGWIEMRGNVRLPPAGLEAPDWPLHFDFEGRISFGDMLPIQGSQTFAPAADATPVDCGHGVQLASRSTAIGTFSHLGRTRSVITTESCELNPGTGIVSMVGAVLHKAANGDELHATWTGAIDDGVLALEIDIDGGTGRFVRANGSARGEGTVDPTIGAGEYTVDGMFSYNASDGPAHKQLPFEAEAVCNVVGMECADESCSGTSTFDGRCSVPSTWVIRFTVEGTSDPLGPIDGWAEHCSQVTWSAPGIPETATYRDGRMEFTLADGAKVWGTYTNGVGTFLEDGTNPFQDEFTFTGGTGRYKNIRGSGIEWGTATALDAPIPLWMKGWVRY
jgi:hypothetical protein